MRKILQSILVPWFAAIIVCTSPVVHAQTIPPATQVSVSTNNFNFFSVPATGKTVQAALDAIDNLSTNFAIDSSGWIFINPTQETVQASLNWLDANLAIITTNWSVLALGTNRSYQSFFDAIDGALTVGTNGFTYLNPSNGTLRALFESVDDALAPEALTASQIGINTNPTLSSLGFAGTNTVQDVLNSFATNNVTQVQLRQFIASYSNQYILSDSWGQTASFSAGPHAADAFVTLLPTNVTSNLFIQVSAGWFQPRQPALVYSIDMALEGTTPAYAIGDDTVAFGVRQSNVLTGEVKLWTDQQMWNRAKTVRANLAITTGLSTNERVSFILNSTTNMTVGSWGAYPKAVGTTVSPTP